jgi:hypothetical protein
MYLKEETARKLLNLNPFPDQYVIDEKVAERQFQVIVKGFNHLLQPENRFLYIADEVGLGKTYIALGIASLLRHFSPNPESFSDVIIVPKKNLQYKWRKEIRNFIINNYLLNDNIVKSVINKPVGNLSDMCLRNQLDVIDKEKSQYVIFRNSSFSLSSDSDLESDNWIQKLQERLSEDQQELFSKIKQRFKKDQILVKHAFAYLINQKIPEIDLLIVDEGHNYKHGVNENVSIRNQIASRTFGACMNDEKLFDAFPYLKRIVKPKVKKLLLLSATPVNTSLIEIKNQLDCFLMDHIFKGNGDLDQTEDTIKDNLNRFLIRGVMELEINENKYSRNGYRHEHRKGNVKMLEIAEPQYIDDNKTALVLSLMQYKTIKELKLKNNNSFEMGLLAGFESFEKTTSNYEEDTLFNKKKNSAKDENVIKDIVDDYHKKFLDYPPHPKQDSLVDELFSLMLNSEKALVFVRRIASVRELERTLLKKYSKHLIGKIKSIKNYERYSQIKLLLEKFDNEAIQDDIDLVLNLLSERIIKVVKPLYIQKLNSDIEPFSYLRADLQKINDSVLEDSRISRIKEEIKRHINRRNMDNSLQKLAILLIKEKLNGKIDLEIEEDDDENEIDEAKFEEEKSPYFFQRFFYNEGKNFKNKSYKKDWYEINLLLVNDVFFLFQVDNQILSHKYPFFENFVDYKKFQQLNEIIIKAIKSDSAGNNLINSEFRTNTFLTELLLGLCKEEFSSWINSHRKLINGKSYTRFIDELDTLNEVLKSIFRQGSGLLPAYIADALTTKESNSREKFIEELINLLKGDFYFIVSEIKRILKDYDKLIERNFDDKNKIRYSLIQQLPVTGVSGYHKRDVRKTAIQFRMPGYPFILIATDILKEGEDLHSYCRSIYHYGIAWNPSDMEQRTGRIDRIDSLTSRLLKVLEGKDYDGIPFSNKLQVFYPYLTDTLEVNQMIKLFKGIDKFIDIFYSDLSSKNLTDSSVSLDEIVDSIPKPRTGVLRSKYEYDSFNSKINLRVSLKPRDPIGYDYNSIMGFMTTLYNGLTAFNYFIKPELDNKLFTITGTLNVRNNRHGPFKILLIQKDSIGEFEFIMESYLGLVQIYGSRHNERYVKDFLENRLWENNQKILLSQRNTIVWTFMKAPLNIKVSRLIDQLEFLVHCTDELEELLTLEDDKNRFD